MRAVTVLETPVPTGILVGIVLTPALSAYPRNSNFFIQPGHKLGCGEPDVGPDVVWSLSMDAKNRSSVRRNSQIPVTIQRPEQTYSII